MVASAPSIVPRQVIRLASALAWPKGTAKRPAEAALMRMKRRRESILVIMSTSIAQPPGRSVLVGYPARLVVAGFQDVVSRHIRESHDAPAIVGGEPLGSGAVRERDGLVA